MPSLTWIGKDAVQQLHRQIPYRMLRCDDALTYRAVGAMNGEEACCASVIDALPGVKWWVGNPVCGPQAFWLPTPTDKFYPDFVVLLKDGRMLVVEFKGSQLLAGSDTREKTAVGKLWETRSGGSCVFRLVSAEDYEAQLRAVAG